MLETEDAGAFGRAGRAEAMSASVICDPLGRAIGSRLLLWRPRLAVSGVSDQIPSRFEVIGDDDADARGQPVQGSIAPYARKVNKKLRRILVGREARGTNSSVTNPHGSNGIRKSLGPPFFPG